MNNKRHLEDIDYESNPTKKLHIEESDIPINDDIELEEEDFEVDKDEILREIMASKQEESDIFTKEYLENIVIQLQKHYHKNQELRLKFIKNPEKFMDSEVDLDEDIRKFSALAAYPELLKYFSDSVGLKTLILIISHENIDISTDALNIFSDLIDIDLTEENSEQLMNFYNELKNNHFLEALIQNLQRLDETKQDQYNAVYKSLKIIENLIEIMTDIPEYLCDNTKILQWILKKIDVKNKLNEKIFDDNKNFSCEILTMLLQNNRNNQFTFGKIGGIDSLLNIIAEYRKKNPETEEEEELIENLYDSLCLCLLLKENLDIFRHLQGIDLMIRILKELNFSSRLALKAISFALTDSIANNKHFIDSLGLKFLFPIFLKRGIKGKDLEEQLSIDEHVCISIIHLIKNTSDIYLDRVINKFKENDFEKIDRLFEIYKEYNSKVKEIEKDIESDVVKKQSLLEFPKNITIEEAIYLKKLEGGLIIVESASILILFLLKNNDSLLQKKLEQILRLFGKNINEFKEILQQKISFITESNEKGEKKFLEKLLI